MFFVAYEQSESLWFSFFQSPVHHKTSVSISSAPGQNNGHAPLSHTHTHHGHPHGHASTTGRTPPKTKAGQELSLLKSRSRENISLLEARQQGADSGSEASYHMARPATVISNSSNSSANTSARSERYGRMLVNVVDCDLTYFFCETRSLGASTHKKLLPTTPGSNPNNLPLLDDKMDWTALVDTATKAINYSEDEQDALSSSDVDHKYDKKADMKRDKLI